MCIRPYWASHSPNNSTVMRRPAIATSICAPLHKIVVDVQVLLLMMGLMTKSSTSLYSVSERESGMTRRATARIWWTWRPWSSSMATNVFATPGYRYGNWPVLTFSSTFRSVWTMSLVPGMCWGGSLPAKPTMTSSSAALTRVGGRPAMAFTSTSLLVRISQKATRLLDRPGWWTLTLSTLVSLSFLMHSSMTLSTTHSPGRPVDRIRLVMSMA
mmetsp:Transcript_40695/g.116019  ORF Transcript_40695/g.116019 Transcript_40695/m.116019 type:complete len:214 (+) Transcript_40695:2203-2844(+)